VFVIPIATYGPTCSRTTFATCLRVMSASRGTAATHHCSCWGARTQSQFGFTPTRSRIHPTFSPPRTTPSRQNRHRSHGSRRQVASRGNQHGIRNANRFSRYLLVHVACALIYREDTSHRSRLPSHMLQRHGPWATHFNLSARMSSQVLPPTGVVIGVVSAQTGMHTFRDNGVVPSYYIGMAIGRMCGSVATSVNLLGRFATVIWASWHRHRAKRKISCEYGYS
jgi:hypothetical protein